jgi:two-component system, chemotaxis family, CheB/CheR fusion protein
MNDSKGAASTSAIIEPRPSVEDRAAFPIVGLGASAGGLEALEKFFSRLPAEPGLALVIVQHLDPDRPSIMPELLSKVTTMPVEHVRDWTHTEIDHVYIIPPNTTLTLEGITLRLARPIAPRHNPIDSFFCSLAEAQGDQAIGIILSGGGSDGAQGIKAIHEHGGMSMAQEPALHDSMPRSAIALGVVDYVLPAEEMPGRLLAHVQHERRAAGVNGQARLDGAAELNDDLRRICALVQRRTEHDFSRYKQATILRRVQRRMQVRQAESVRDYLDLLRDPAEADQLFRSLLIGVTRFFRDADAFDALAHDILPSLLKHKGAEQDIRVWVAGCSSGEEAYSIAILLREATAKLDFAPRIKVFATDIDDVALETARSGRYPEVIADQVSPARLQRFFIKQLSGYQVCKELREMCIFSNHNLIADPPFSHLDLLCCRNVLIYFESDVQKKLVPLFHFALDPGGFLFLGPSESVDGYSELFRPRLKKHRLYQRQDALGPPMAAFPLLHPLRLPKQVPSPTPMPTQTPEQGLVKSIEKRLLDEYSPATVIVNEGGEILYVYGRTRKYLELSPGAPNVNVVDMVRNGIRTDVLTALREAVRTREGVVRPDVAIEMDGQIQRLNLIVQPLALPALDGSPSGLLMVVFQELGPLLSRKQADSEGAVPPYRDNIVHELEVELRSTKESLRTTVEEFKASTEELKSTNEELVSTNEELQSTNEEMQTSKEELQSINEELQTVNIELHRKVDEVDRINGDLQNLFASTQIAIIFLDNDLHIQKFSPATKGLFRVIESDIGRPITDIAVTFADDALLDHVQEVLQTLEPREQQVHRADGDLWYIRRIRPYRSFENTIDGVVITFVDITELKRAQARIAYLAAIVESSQEAIIGQSLDGTITSWNAGAEQLFGYSHAEAIGRSYALLMTKEEMVGMARLQDRLRRGDHVEAFEARRMSKTGTALTVFLTLSPVLDTSGTIVGISTIAHDITGRRVAEEGLRMADQRKNEFLAMLGHELRNPLAPILNAAQILRHLAHGDPATARAQEIIERQGRHMTRLIDDLLDVSRISSGKILLRKEPLDVVELIRTVVEDHRADIESGSLSVDVVLPARPLYVLGDRARLAQIVDNLMHNAAKFTDAGGQISVSVQAEGGSCVALSVKDTGIGMDSETLARLFEPFIQADRSLERSRGGLGLGLSVVKSMVELHEGTVTAESKGPGRGAEFSIRLPLVKPPASAQGTESSLGRARGPLRILVVEDNIDAAETLDTLLQLWGHTVALAHAGAEGIALARDFQPHVVLCDIGLPGGLDGYAVARELRARADGGAPFLVALTGYGQDEDQRLAAAAGFDRHLVKPVDHDVLEKLLSRLPR